MSRQASPQLNKVDAFVLFSTVIYPAVVIRILDCHSQLITIPQFYNNRHINWIPIATSHNDIDSPFLLSLAHSLRVFVIWDLPTRAAEKTTF